MEAFLRSMLVATVMAWFVVDVRTNDQVAGPFQYYSDCARVAEAYGPFYACQQR